MTHHNSSIQYPYRSFSRAVHHKGPLMGTPNREHQDYSRNITEYKDPDSYSIPTTFLVFPIWGSH